MGFELERIFFLINTFYEYIDSVYENSSLIYFQSYLIMKIISEPRNVKLRLENSKWSAGS